jgi:hypothetical protein
LRIADIDENTKAGLFKSLASNTMYAVGVEFGFDKHYKSASGVRSAVKKIYNEVKNDPEKFFIHPDTVELVMKAVSERSVAPMVTLREKSELKVDIKDIILHNRDLTAKLIGDKLEQLSRSKKDLKNESLVNLSKVMATLFDKGQIVQGQATEHVALLGKLDKDMSPDAAIATVLKMREINNSK